LEQRNVILAVVLSVGILLGYQLLFEVPRLQREAELARQQAAETAPAATVSGEGEAPRPDAAVPGSTGGAQATLPREHVIAEGPRVAIAADRVTGSIARIGARIDDLTLTDYRTEADAGSPPVILLSPAGTAEPYFAEFGWVAAPGLAVALPGSDTVWSSDRDALHPGAPVTLSWDNGEGTLFTQRIDIDDNYLFTVTQGVENRSGQPLTLFPYGLVGRHGTPPTLGFYILHEGPLGVLGGTLKEIDYDDLKEDGGQEFAGTGGWVGITDKYWLTALVPDQKTPFTAHALHALKDGQDRYQVDVLGGAVTVAPGARAEVVARLFAGAKVVRLIEGYGERYGIERFDLAIDWGWFPFLTKPLFWLLEQFFHLVGNFGIAILLLTVCVRAAFFPLANKSYQAMSKLKKLQPEMKKLQERFKDDRAAVQREMMALYKREKANPAAGCLPILLQIPVFFALYKVLFVTIEMRHTPFFGWIEDLSAPDPTTIFNLFGLIPWTPPTFLMIGVWPLLMGITMFLQTKINPQPPDPTQAKIMLFLPVIFTFILAPFPAGLVIYWTWSNLLSIAQQWIIMRRMGVKA
jgi:YidC/Oxa1 family membrane protein insertase